MNEKDFVNEKPIEVEIEGKKFLLKEPNGFEADEISDKYLKVAEDGKITISLAERNRAWFSSLVVDAPYEIDGKPFKELKPTEKADLLNKLKAEVRNPLLKEINKLINPKGDVKKK